MESLSIFSNDRYLVVGQREGQTEASTWVMMHYAMETVSSLLDDGYTVTIRNITDAEWTRGFVEIPT